MSKGLYQVTVKPTITASLQHTAAFTNKDLLFDWTEFYVPAGVGRLVGIAAFVRGTDGVKQRRDFELYFSKTDDFSLGTINSPVSTQPNNDFIGAAYVEKRHYFTVLDTMAVANAKFSYSGVNLTSIKEPLGATGVKWDGRYHNYVAGADDGVQTNFDFRSTVSCTGVQAITQSTLTVGTTSALINFGPGDVLHDEDDRLLGTVKTVNSATEITMVDNLANATVNAKKVYNVNPIVLQFTFGSSANV
tara:strand:- start:1074 stop:1814 length:741 start_codon:yes stop_codon:yes gene_type:complete